MVASSFVQRVAASFMFNLSHSLFRAMFALLIARVLTYWACSRSRRLFVRSVHETGVIGDLYMFQVSRGEICKTISAAFIASRVLVGYWVWMSSGVALAAACASTLPSSCCVHSSRLRLRCSTCDLTLVMVTRCGSGSVPLTLIVICVFA